MTVEPRDNAADTAATATSGIDRALADEAIAQVRIWLESARGEKVDAAAKNLAGVLSDPNGLDFAVGFVDGVVQPEDLRVAARNFRRVSQNVPGFLPAPLRGLVRLGGAVATTFPQIVVPIARRVLRGMVRHLIVDASESKLGPALAKVGGEGTRLNVNLLGEAILGQREAAKRVAGTIRLIERDDVDYMSIKVSSTVAPHSLWAHEQAVDEAVDALAPVYRAALANDTFLNLDMEEYKDLDLTLDVFQRILDRDEFQAVRAGIVLQAYLPDSLGAMIRLQEWAAHRVANGGTPVKVRVVKGANLPMEQVDAETHDWPIATWPSKQHTDAGYKQVLDYALTPERIAHVHIGIAGHNLFDIALAKLLAEKRGIRIEPGSGVEFEMLLGMATQQAAVVRRDVGELLLYTPVVHPDEFDVAIAYLIRRLEEGASSDNFMSVVFEIDSDERLFQREQDRFLTSIEMMPTEVPTPNRVMDRSQPQPDGPRGEFHGVPDTDPAVAVNRDWAAGIRARMENSELGEQALEDATIRDSESLDALIDGAVSAAQAWTARPLAERVEILHRAGDALETHRADLLEVMGSECGKVVEQGDPEVSEAIDFAHFYARSAELLADVDGAEYTSAKVTAVIPPWNFPAAIPAGGVLAALAAGSAVVFKPARQAARTGAVIAEALWEAGVPRDVLRLVKLQERELGSQLLAHPSVDQAILTGAYETAELFRSFRPDLPLLAETSGKNALIVTPSADVDLAAKDAAYSAFGHAGQKCSAASLIVLVGSVAKSERFHRQLLDAIDGYEVGMPWTEGARIGPIIAPAEGKLLRGLTELEPGQTWLLEPKQLGDALWTPGLREGVKPGSEFHMTEYFGPVAGIIAVDTLEEAIEVVNAVDYGLTSGLHSLDVDEIQQWLGSIQAGNAYVNRVITGAIVQRQPFGGWKKSAVGAGTKAGGPSYLFGLGTWTDVPVTGAASSDAAVRRAAAAVPADDRGWLESALGTDIAAWNDEFGVARDVQGLELEQNVLRYVPTAVTVRFEGTRTAELVRVVAAGVRIGAPITVSSAEGLSGEVREYLTQAGVVARVEDADEWAARAASFTTTGARIRLIGGSAEPIIEATKGEPNIAIYRHEVTSAGRVEMLPFVREQAVSITAHRFGNPRRYEVQVAAGGASDLIAR
ncbi:bifunctional proline dehydrogenase/L-glutamate gamma-semialdehyde dehydrogenase [Microbacterium sp. JB110]|uniref:bifunctional proline dehydrogenase/L-glutamate gamma-semialdehyde dehydrogenase n=1 Tax=Microbacterium sp. JB110 TaxID=2024477 RepID=UPI00097F5A52|nr:bifunctional proline dehydrogenase/L-glutamate gamma-semialdehyde dehydrogenase [Microbacterium sp. JB110]RCS62769.1 aldehyde dehydrogenase family protein [Microbacterium sp. JB110]SJM62880.1 Proline dehydrogenase / Delta-1-pyrroline-5-carboxylate dehydrogenase [Frigoribacterium sp. JB110]